MPEFTDRIKSLINDRIEKALDYGTPSKKAADAQWARQPRKLLNGQEFPLGTTRGSTTGGGAPGVVRAGSLGSQT